DLRAIGPPAIHEHVSGSTQVPAEKRKAAERFLGDDPQLIRQRPEQDRNVVDALMIRDEYVRSVAVEAIEAGYLNANAGRGQDQPRPCPRAPVSEVAGL